ncbi:MgtC/SapB family protein [Planococcus sp. N028]|uniref:MgtC/SapB family protein n=1 Tax=Planococcus shixiaomingii TaxID=3058393 RepID=A0ABT8N2A9_9BACL|nr:MULTISPECIES: MgtC/SapB family protein [unclassified Planococcus (in: firmicutes)]MDN7242026.1 MgtC/SapB family protein [Planococcus sp. N028]WKA54304.1 MgtC/SapB family protein [Planococcus sp. N022]
MGFLPEDYIDIIIRLLLATVLSGLIGIERESKRQPAGLRTHVLVGTGSCLMMILSVTGFDSFLQMDNDAIRFDPGRIPSYVISGIGFLGAGTIIVQRGSVRGLTTAASIWVAAGIGLVVGIDMYFVAILTTAIVLITLHLVEKFERKYLSMRNQKSVIVFAKDQADSFATICKIIEESQLEILGFEIDNEEVYTEKNVSKYVFTVKGGNVQKERDLVKNLWNFKAVCKVII